MALSEQEIEELQKEVILLRMRNERLESDIKKYQLVIKDILIREIATELSYENTEHKNETEDASKNNTGHSENPA